MRPHSDQYSTTCGGLNTQTPKSHWNPSDAKKRLQNERIIGSQIVRDSDVRH
jgi:hypothetical protein